MMTPSTVPAHSANGLSFTRRLSRFSARALTATVTFAIGLLGLSVLPAAASSGGSTQLAWGPLPAIAVGSQPVAMIPDTSGNMWVANSGSNTVQELTDVSNTWMAQSPISVGNNPRALAATSDGGVWVATDAGVQEILNGSVATTLASTTAAVSLTVGTDGGLWVLLNNDEAEEFTLVNGTWTAGASVTFSGGSPHQIYATSDGNIWVSFFDMVLIQITKVNGTWTALSNGTGFNPSSWAHYSIWMTEGTDGSIWTSSQNGIQQAIYSNGTWNIQPRIDSNGHYGEALTTAGDGSIWMADGAGRENIVQQFASVNGVVTPQTPIHVGSDPWAITTGADGNVWVVNRGDGTVQELVQKPIVASTFTSSATASMVAGQPVTVNVATSGGFPTPNLSVSDPLPYGLSFTDNSDGTATISGSPSADSAGTYILHVNASNAGVVTTQVITITITGGTTAMPTPVSGVTLGGQNFCGTNAIAMTSDGSLWASSTSNYIQQLSPSTPNSPRVQLVTVGNSPTYLTGAADGNLWFLNRNDQTLQTETDDAGTWTLSTPLRVGTNTTAIAAASSTGVWVSDATANTITYYSLVNGTITAGQVLSVPSGSDPTGVLVDNQGDVWVGLSGPGALEEFQYSSGNYTAQTPIQMAVSGLDMVMALYTDGSLLVTYSSEQGWSHEANAGQLQQVTESNGVWTAQAPINLGLAVDNVDPSNMVVTANGAVWIGTNGDYLSESDLINGTWYTQPPMWTGYWSRWLAADSSGNLWASDSGCIQAQEWTQVNGTVPAITSTPAATMSQSAWASFNISAVGNPAPTMTYLGNLPAGLNLYESSPGHMVLSGQVDPSVPVGDYTVNIVAENNVQRPIVQQFTIHVVQAPEYSVTYTDPANSGTMPTQADEASGTQFQVASANGLVNPGYTFAGWSDGSTTYQPGDNYTMGSSPVTFTAQWTPTVEAITYSAGTGTGTVPTQASEAPTTVIQVASADGISNPGHVFAGWSDGTTTYHPGDNYTVGSSPVTFTAQWTALPTASTPSITNLPSFKTDADSYTATVSTNGDGTTSVTSSTTGVCTASGLSVTFVGAGTCTLTAQVADGTTYGHASGSAQSFPVYLGVASAPHISNIPSPAHVGHSFTATVSTTGDGNVSITSATPGVCSVSGLQVSLLAAGTCTLTPSVATSTNYLASTGSHQSFTVSRSTPSSVSISGLSPSVGVSTTKTVTITTNSDGRGSITTTTPSVCKALGLTVRFLTTGKCVLVGHVAQSASYLAASGSPQTFMVKMTPADPKITNAPSSAKVGTHVTIKATSSGPGAVTVSSKTPSVCTVSGFSVRFVAAGTCSLVATIAATPTSLSVTGFAVSILVTRRS